MAVKYWVGGTDTWNTVAGSKWSLTSGVVTPTTIPAVGDDVYFDAASGTGTVTIGAGAIATNIYFTHPVTGNYGGTLNMATTLAVGNNFTLSPAVGFSVTGTGTLSKGNNGGTLTSNGKTWSGSLQTPNGGGWITTFGDNWTILGNMVGTSNPVNINAAAMRIITIGGSLNTGAAYQCTNITFVLNGTGSISSNITGATIILNTSGTITQPALGLTNCIFTVTNVGLYTSTGNLSLGGTNSFNSVDTINFFSIVLGGGGGATATLFSNMNITNGLTADNGSSTFQLNGLFNCNVGGNIAVNGLGVGGTSTIVMNGLTNASITHTATGIGNIQNSLTINKTGGASVSILPALTGLNWGGTGKTLTTPSSAQFNPGTCTVYTYNNSNVSISENISFWNFSPGTNTTTNII